MYFHWNTSLASQLTQQQHEIVAICGRYQRLTTTVVKVEPVEHPKELSEQVEEELATLPPEEPE